MKKIILFWAINIAYLSISASDSKLTKVDSCGYLYQWKTLPVKGKCPQITDPIVVNGTLFCKVKCSYLREELEKSGTRRVKEELDGEPYYHPIY